MGQKLMWAHAVAKIGPYLALMVSSTPRAYNQQSNTLNLIRSQLALSNSVYLIHITMSTLATKNLRIGTKIIK